jgi:hypothetical protein
MGMRCGTKGPKLRQSHHRSSHLGASVPLSLSSAAPTVLVRKASFERAGLTRQAIDERLSLTPDEFRVEGGLIAIGPIHGDDELTMFVEELEAAGLVYFDDFFDLSGNWPEWLRIFVQA